MRNREENDVDARLVLNEVLIQTNYKDIKNSKTLDANNSKKRRPSTDGIPSNHDNQLINKGRKQGLRNP
jgi:hypothetical protein